VILRITPSLSRLQQVWSLFATDHPPETRSDGVSEVLHGITEYDGLEDTFVIVGVNEYQVEAESEIGFG
jgi:hypothetical protein